MPPVLGILAAAAPALSAIGAATAIVGTVKSVKAQKKSADLQDQQQKLTTRRSTIQALREAQIKKASAIASGSVQGGLDSSSLAGGLSGLDAQLGSGLGYASQQSGLSSGITKAQSSADLWQAISQLGGAAYQVGKSMK